MVIRRYATLMLRLYQKFTWGMLACWIGLWYYLEDSVVTYHYDNILVRVDCPGDTDSLLLSSTHVDSFFSYLSLVSAREDFNIWLESAHFDGFLVPVGQ